MSTSKGVHVESHMLMSEAIPLAMGGRAAEGPAHVETSYTHTLGTIRIGCSHILRLRLT